ncbi:MAG: hypothetical protein FWE94_04820 [Coriobacteriia bacterium]|nr:hypothetical protein [Coriobacteriia bacterium]
MTSVLLATCIRNKAGFRKSAADGRGGRAIVEYNASNNTTPVTGARAVTLRSRHTARSPASSGWRTHGC